MTLQVTHSAPLPSGEPVLSLVHGIGQFFAMDAAGNVFRTSDPETNPWVLSTTASVQDGDELYSSGEHVAIFGGGRASLFVTNDGVSWGETTPPGVDDFGFFVSVGPNRFYALVGGGKVTSDGGQTWQSATVFPYDGVVGNGVLWVTRDGWARSSNGVSFVSTGLPNLSLLTWSDSRGAFVGPLNDPDELGPPSSIVITSDASSLSSTLPATYVDAPSMVSLSIPGAIILSGYDPARNDQPVQTLLLDGASEGVAPGVVLRMGAAAPTFALAVLVGEATSTLFKLVAGAAPARPLFWTQHSLTYEIP